MAEGSGNRDGQDELSQMKRKLAWRMGIAGLMIVALLGGLTLFDRLASGPGESEPASPRFTEPVPVPKKTVTQAVGTAEPAPAPEKEGKATPESTAAPADRAAPFAEQAPESAAAHPPAGRSTPKQAARPVSAPQTAAPAQPGEAKKNDSAAVTPTRPEQPVSAAAGPAAARQAPALAKLLSGYTLQAGVFSDTRRAEDLHARLVQEGIPATLETRVLVGPFRSREEADAARAKMLVMGVDALQLPRSAKK